jgi:TRAP-type C4-dicarboxylate transport system permease small subunit
MSDKVKTALITVALVALGVTVYFQIIERYIFIKK